MSTNDFTERERTIMACAWQCFEEQPKVRVPRCLTIFPPICHSATPQVTSRLNIPWQVDYVKLAGLVGMGNPRSATNAWLAIRKKLVAQTGPVAATSSIDGDATPTPAKTTKKRKGKDDSPKATPAKKGRKSQKAQAKEEKEEEGEEAVVKAEAEDEEPVLKTMAEGKEEVYEGEVFA